MLYNNVNRVTKTATLITKMIDTVVMGINEFDIGCFDLSNVENLKTVETNGNIWHSGKLGKFDIMFKADYIRISGSLAKYYLGNNVATMARSDIEKAVAKMSKDFGLDVSNFDVWRIDIGATFLMNHSVCNYLAYLESCPRYKPVLYPESKMFINGQRTLIFYDKVKDVIKKESKHVIQQLKTNGVFRETDNYFRYEMQIKRKTRKTFGLTEFKARHLYDEKVYIKMIELWQREFFKVKKKREIMDFQSEEQINPGVLKNSLASIGLENLGKQELIDMLTRKYQNGEIQKHSYFNMKKMLLGLENKFGAKSEYIEELEKEVNNRANYCR